VRLADHTYGESLFGGASNLSMHCPNMEASTATAHCTMGCVCIYVWIHVWMACSRESLPALCHPTELGCHSQFGGCRPLYFFVNRFAFVLNILAWSIVSVSSSLFGSSHFLITNLFGMFPLTIAQDLVTFRK
jgi:hypothetical protein